VDCHGLHTVCKVCGREFGKSREFESCPDCGTSRKCGRSAVPGYNFCPFHGGPNPTHDYWGAGTVMTTGSGSRFPLTRLAAKKNEMARDGKILSNRKSIDILGRRIDELLERIDENRAADRMNLLYKLWEKYKDAEREDDELKVLKARSNLDDAFEAGYHDYQSWRQMFEALDLHRTLVESEVKIAKDLHAILTAEDAYELIAEIFAVILRVEDNPKKLKRYQYELTRIVGEGSVIETGSGDDEDRDGSGPGTVDREELLYTRNEE